MKHNVIDATQVRRPGSPGGQVIKVGPYMLCEADAAVFLGKSQSWVRSQRMMSLAQIKAGETPTGPPWVTVGNTIGYRVKDLIAWIEGLAVENGRTQFRGNVREGA